MRIDFRWAVLLVAVGAAVGCSRATQSTTKWGPQFFRGFYVIGPGRSAFRACGLEEQWYVAGTTASAGLALQRMTAKMHDGAPPGGMRTQPPVGTEAGGFYRSYVELQGDTLQITAGPEMDTYARELRPTKLLVVQRFARGECP